MEKNTGTVREYKGKSILDFPSDYVLVDIETTGILPERDEIIEISAIRIKDNNIVGTFSELVKVKGSTKGIVERKTGITDKMLSDKEEIKEVLKKFLVFIEDDDILVGYNFNFDINFLYDFFEKELDYYLMNDFIDVLRFSKALLKNKNKVEDCKLQTISEFYKIDYSKAHRGEEDCLITFEVFKKLKEEVIKQFGSVEKILRTRRNR